MSVEINELMKQPGVIDVGKVGQKQLAKMQLNATAWLYPADTIQATETGCITAIENMAAGNPCITTDADCLKDEFGEVAEIVSLPMNTDEFAYTVTQNILECPSRMAEMQEKGRNFAEGRDWSRIAPTWINLFKENYAQS
jgi:glycosyltransferase involved in cell wall biosynthesis